MDDRVSIGSRTTLGSYQTDDDYLLSQSFDGTEESHLLPNSYGAINEVESRDMTMIAMDGYDQFSVHTVCPHCNQETDTVLRHHNGSATLKCIVLLAILTCGLLSCLPFILNDFKDVEHKCQHCDKTIATYKRNFISR